MNNTIKLIKGDEILTRDEWKKFKKHDSILGIDRTPEELQMWSITQEADAKAELAKYNCEYIHNIETVHAIEYALEYCQCDEDGEFIEGSDYDFAEEKAE